jgi:hypothetical protein
VAGITSANVVAVRRRLVAAKYKAHARDMRRHRPRPPLAALRLSELERLYTARWGRQLPDDDAGRDDLLLAFNHISGIDSCIEWAMAWAPWLSRDDATALAEQITAAPQWLKARPMGERLGLTDYERTALKIRTIRPIDVTDACLAERRKQKDRDRKALRRQLARAAKPAPASQTKPWEAEGIDRATWYRRKAKSAGQKRATKSVRSNTESFTADGNCRISTPDRIGATTPPAKAVGTHSKTIWYEVVDGVAVVGDDRKRFKTRFSTSMRLSTEARQYAIDACFEPAEVDLMFETFGYYNIAKRAYSLDWDAVWRNWVDREVDIQNEAYNKARARAYAMGAAA